MPFWVWVFHWIASLIFHYIYLINSDYSGVWKKDSSRDTAFSAPYVLLNLSVFSHCILNTDDWGSLPGPQSNVMCFISNFLLLTAWIQKWSKWKVINHFISCTFWIWNLYFISVDFLVQLVNMNHFAFHL